MICELKTKSNFILRSLKLSQILDQIMSSNDIQTNGNEDTERRIKQMDTKTAKTLSSGQVVVNLSNVVKELIENSMDAKSTVITIRVKDMGKELVEVIDNGFGIDAKDFDSLAKRHFTSKLSAFEDLPSITSFGFRGEALNSLCNLAEVSVSTRHLNQMVGTILRFDSDGHIISKEPKAMNVGTTVSVRNLFHNIPVRKREFQTNINRDFDKMVRLVYGYCVGSVGLRITLTNQMPNKPNQTVLSSHGLSIQNNIRSVFDSKQLESLVEIQPLLVTNEDNSSKDIKIKGFISKPDSGFGRSAADRQFFYVNRRPCDMKNVSKFINNIYRSFNKNQFPFVLLNIEIDKTLVDFNLSADKRQLLIASEDQLFAIIKQTLNQMFDKQSDCRLESMTKYTTNSSQFTQKRRFEGMDDKIDSQMIITPLKVVRSRSPCDSPFKDTSRVSLVVSPPVPHSPQTERPKSFSTALNAINAIERPKAISVRNNSPIDRQQKDSEEISIKDIPVCVRDVSMGTTSKRVFSAENIPNVSTSSHNREHSSSVSTGSHNREYSPTVSTSTGSPGNHSLVDKSNRLMTQCLNAESDEEMSKSGSIDTTNDVIMDLDINSIAELMNKSFSTEETVNEHKFSAKINASQNSRAEQELIHELSKSSFESMKIIGQFNKSFVVTKLGTDLFVVDPHASDERFNYETLLRETKIEIQNLVKPLALELSSANEQVVINYLNQFKDLGFGIVVDDKAPAGQRLFLSSIPMSKEWTAGKEDIEEIIGTIVETPIQLLNDYKLNAFKKVIASRACRSAVMIGDSLSESQMKTIVSNMSELQNPWHCAHNRPTIRHLVNLSDISLISKNNN